MGRVLLARQRDSASGLDRPVALKRLLPGLGRDSDAVAAFLAEARLSALVSHANVCHVLDAGVDDEGAFIAMELLRGRTWSSVTRRLRQRRPDHTDEAVIARLFANFAHGLHAAHTLVRPSGEPACVVHRDVSPQNLFVTWSGVGKVMDFGVAKAAGSSKTDTGVLKGKPAYMPPEQFRGQPPSPGFDIWALGVCLWEAVAGCRLFVGDDPAAIMMQVLTGPIGKASSVSGSSARFDDAIAHALQRDPAKRLLTARAFAQAVSEAVPASRSLHDEDVAEWLEAIFPGDRLLDQQKLADALRG